MNSINYIFSAVVLLASVSAASAEALQSLLGPIQQGWVNPLPLTADEKKKQEEKMKAELVEKNCKPSMSADIVIASPEFRRRTFYIDCRARTLEEIFERSKCKFMQDK